MLDQRSASVFACAAGPLVYFLASYVFRPWLPSVPLIAAYLAIVLVQLALATGAAAAALHSRWKLAVQLGAVLVHAHMLGAACVRRGQPHSAVQQLTRVFAGSETQLC